MAVQFDEDFLRALQQQMENFASAVDRTGNPLTDFGRELDANSKRIKQERAARAEQAAAMERFTRSTLSLAGQLKSGEGSFTAMNGIIDIATKAFGSLVEKIPLVGGILSGTTKAVAEASKFMIEEFNKAYGVFEQLSDVGVVRNFQDLQGIMDKTNLSFESINKALAKNSQNLSKLGSNVLDGRTRFEEVAKESVLMRMEFQRLGVTSSEFNDFQISNMAQMQLLGQMEGKNARDISGSTEKYVLQLDALSKLTGQSRKELQNELEARMRDTQYRAALSKRPELKESFDVLLSSFKKFDPKMEEAVKEMFSGIATSGAAVIGPASAQLAVQFPELEQSIRRVVAGQTDVSEVYNTVIKSAKRVGNTFSDVAPILKDSNIATGLFVAQQNARNAVEMQSFEDLKKQSKIQKETTGDVNDALASTKIKLENIAVNISKAATQFDTLTTAMNKFAGAIDYVIAKIPGTGPTAASRGLGGQSGGSAASGASSSAGGSRAGTMPPRMGMSKLRDEYNQEPGSGEAPQTSSSGSGAPKLTRISSKSGKSTMVNTEYADRFQKLIDYLDVIGYNIYSLSGYVDRDIKGQPGVKSVHAKGGAIDINPSDNPEQSKLITDIPAKAVEFAKSLGLGWGGAWTSKKDPMHFSVSKFEGGNIELAKGGIASGPYSGFPATLHGNELIQPLSRNSILEKLATTPINEIFTPTVTETRNIDTGNDIKKMSESMNDKFDSMIRVLADIKGIQSKILTRSFA